MSYFDKTNTFFYGAYIGIFDYACLPARSIEFVVPDRNKKISDYNGKEMISAAMMGIFVAIPLSCITFPMALKAITCTFIAHIITAAISVFLDAATHLSNSYYGARA